MKKTQIAGWFLMAAMIATAVTAAPYVELPNGTRVSGVASGTSLGIRALPNGDINLTTEAGLRTYPKGSYVKAVADKPAEYDQAAALIKGGKFTDAAKILEGLVTKYRFLGWDVEASKLLAQARLGAGDAEGAVKAFDQLFLQAPEEKKNTATMWEMRRAMIQAKQYPALLRQLDAVAAGGNRAEAARAQTMRGDIEMAQNHVELAALDYLRTAILFADVKDATVLGEAAFKAAQALETLRDPRAKEMYKKVVSEYGSSPFAAQARGKI